MNKCPYCQRQEKQVKNGLNPSGSQRYRCKECQRNYTPAPSAQGYPVTVREQAIKLYVDGMNLRRIARILGVNHQSVANWVAQHTATLPQAPVPDAVETIELDELFTFVDSKKRCLSDDCCRPYNPLYRGLEHGLATR